MCLCAGWHTLLCRDAQCLQQISPSVAISVLRTVVMEGEGGFFQQPLVCSGSHHWQRSLPAHHHPKCLPIQCTVLLRSLGPQQLMALGPLFRSDLAAHRKYGHPPQMLPQTHWALTLLSPQPRSSHKHLILHQEDVSSAGMSLLKA